MSTTQQIPSVFSHKTHVWQNGKSVGIDTLLFPSDSKNGVCSIYYQQITAHDVAIKSWLPNQLAHTVIAVFRVKFKKPVHE